MTHLKTTKDRKAYLRDCGYTYTFLNKQTAKDIAYLYRKHEKEKQGWF